ncbi:MAG: SUMF1/EgtB/PvdO family nonheme iron enzyme [Prosthecobacter sp.]
MAPEALTLGAAVDHRADIYAVGVMLYQMLTGKVPHCMFELPSRQVAGLDPRYDAIVAAAMREDRDARYQTADELRRDLDGILTQPVPPEGVAARGALRPETDRRREWEEAEELQEGGDLPQTRKAHSTSWMVALLAVSAAGLLFWTKPRPASDSAAPVSPAGVNAVGPQKPPATAQEQATTTAGTPKLAVAPSPRSSAPNAVVPAKTSVLSVKPAASAPLKSAPPGAVQVVAAARPVANGLPPDYPSELSSLDKQFQQLQAQRVKTVFEQDVAKLRASYHAALEREAAKERTAGRLDGVQALHAEMYLLQMNKPVPAQDEVNGNDAVHNLRNTYRASHAKLEDTRLANLRALTAPLIARLKTLEADYTRKGAANDVKSAHDYLAYVEALQAGNTASSPNPQSNRLFAVQNTGSMPRIPANLQPPGSAPVDLSTAKQYTNWLGMEFVPVKGTNVLFCLHETRRADYAEYVSAVGIDDAPWKSATYGGMPAGSQDEHPVVAVSWQEARAFCIWLTKRDGHTHRLPTDHEWSIASGVGQAELRMNNTTPETLHEKEQTLYPWGRGYPPRTADRAGNYPDATYHQKLFGQPPGIENYADGFATTAPVMSFAPNKNGIYDMGGNAWEWVEDWWNAQQRERTARGGSYAWLGRTALLLSCRTHKPQDYRHATYGFRCVVEVAATKP